MLYDYRCTNVKKKCKNVQEEECSFKTFKTFKPKCKKCGAPCKYEFTPTIIQFALKDGPSGSWPSKGNRFKAFRNKKDEEMKRRQKDRYGHLQRDAIPNYKGKDTGTWQEAQFQALKDKGAESAATFNQKIRLEKKNSKKIIV